MGKGVSNLISFPVAVLAWEATQDPAAGKTAAPNLITVRLRATETREADRALALFSSPSAVERFIRTELSKETAARGVHCLMFDSAAALVVLLRGLRHDRIPMIALDPPGDDLMTFEMGKFIADAIATKKAKGLN